MAHHAYPANAAPVHVIDARAYIAWKTECERAVRLTAAIGRAIVEMGPLGNDTQAAADTLAAANELLLRVADLLEINNYGGINIDDIDG